MKTVASINNSCLISFGHYLTITESEINTRFGYVFGTPKFTATNRYKIPSKSQFNASFLEILYKIMADSAVHPWAFRRFLDQKLMHVNP